MALRFTRLPSAARRLRRLVSRSPSIQSPTPQRFRTLARTLAEQQRLDGDVLVELRPVNADSRSDELPPSTLRWPPLRETWVPRQRHGYAAPVGKSDDERCLRDADAASRCCRQTQRTHATPSAIPPDDHAPGRRFGSVHSAGIRRRLPPRRVPATTWPSVGSDSHERAVVPSDRSRRRIACTDRPSGLWDSR